MRTSTVADALHLKQEALKEHIACTSDIIHGWHRLLRSRNPAQELGILAPSRPSVGDRQKQIRMVCRRCRELQDQSRVLALAVLTACRSALGGFVLVQNVRWLRILDGRLRTPEQVSERGNGAGVATSKCVPCGQHPCCPRVCRCLQRARCSTTEREKAALFE